MLLPQRTAPDKNGNKFYKEQIVNYRIHNVAAPPSFKKL